MRDINFLISKGIDINKSLELFGDISTYNKTVGEFLNGIKEKISFPVSMLEFAPTVRASLNNSSVISL